MQAAPIYTSWKITCRSAEDAQALRRWLAGRIDLDRTLTDTVRVAPDGMEQVQTVQHRLGDYFAAIDILADCSSDSASLRLAFEKLPNAGRFWKDLMVNILQEIETAAQECSIVLDFKGDKEPAARSG